MSVTRITPWAVNGPAANYGLASSLSGTATNVPAGALIVTSVEAQTTTAPSVSDTAGNTYTVVLGETSSSHVSIWFAYCLSAIANTANIITWTSGAAELTGAQGATYTTSSGTWSFDTSVGNLSAYATPLSLSITTARAGVIYGGFGEYYTGADVWSVTGLTAQASQAGSSSGNGTIGCLLADDITSAGVTGLSISVSDANAAYGGYIAGIAASFVVSGGGGASASAAQTDGADTQAATGTPRITTSAAQTDSADTQAATATPLITSSAAQTDGADTQAASASIGAAVSASAAQTDGADTQAATATPLITSSAAQTDGTDTQAATGAPLITSSATQTDGADTQNAHAAPITGVAASAAQTDGADTQAATGTPLITSSAAQTDPTDIQVGTVYVAFIDANLADLFACQQAAVSQYYTGSKPTPLNFQVFITSGSWTVPANTTTVYVSATAAGGSPFGGAGQQVLKQQLKAIAGDTVSVAIGQTVAVSVNGAQQLFLNPGGAYGKFQAQAWGQSSYIQGFGNGADTGSGDPALAVILWS